MTGQTAMGDFCVSFTWILFWSHSPEDLCLAFVHLVKFLQSNIKICVYMVEYFIVWSTFDLPSPFPFAYQCRAQGSIRVGPGSCLGGKL